MHDKLVMSPSTFFESYPPLFRQAGSLHQVAGDIDGLRQGIDYDETFNHAVDSDPLPVVDSRCMDRENLSEICRVWGMFRLVNHGIPTNLLNKLHDHAKNLFSIGFESKQASFTNPISYFWGSPALSSSGVALRRGPRGEYLNWIEGVNVPLSQLAQHKYEDPWLESFRSLLEEYGKHQSRLATTIFRAMISNLELGPTQSESYLSTATGFVRAYRYPRCFEAGQAWGIDVHTDSSVLSILHQDEVGGLQVYNDDKWHDVRPIPGTLIVNLGDMMQAISNDEYISVKHRVRVNRHKERISFGYFVFPSEAAVIESSNYKPFTYADFRAEVVEDLKTIGFKVGLQKFKRTEASCIQKE